MNNKAFLQKHNIFELGKKYDGNLEPIISEDNRKRLIWLSGIVAIAMLAMLGGSFLADSLQKNRMIYILICMICTCIFIASIRINNRFFVAGMIYLFIATMFLFGILLGTVVEPNETSVSFPILLFAMPLCFTEKPWRMNLAVFVGIIAYCFAAFATQTSLMIQYNLTNVIPYGIFSMFIGWVMMRIKINRYELQYQYEKSLEKQENQIEKITALNLQLAYDRDFIQKQFALSEAVSRDINDIFLVDIDKKTSTCIKFDGTMLEESKQNSRDYDSTWLQYTEKYVHPDDRNNLLRATRIDTVAAELFDKAEYFCSFRMIMDERIRYIQVNFSYLGEKGSNYLVVGFRCIDDIVLSEIKQKQELKKAKDEADAANKAKTDFLFNMSHDIRTPMNAIIGYTNLIKKQLDHKEKCEEYLEKLEKSNDFLLSLINNVLEMAKIDSGKVMLDEEVLMPAGILNEVKSVFADAMRNKHLVFHEIIDVKTPYIWGDKTKLSEIMLNLVSNAYKYTPEGGSVTASLRELPCDEQGWTILQTTVEDTGIGMSEEYLTSIFEEFSREKNVTEAKIQGTGLGMSIVKKLVDLMGGTITVESKQAKGSKFVVTIHHRIADEPKILFQEANESDFSFLEGKRVLLAEDNEFNAEIAIEMLTESGVLVDHAIDGVECVNMLQKAPCNYYDLILMDIQMPNMNGYETTRTIRQMSDPCKNQIPIIAMTANAFEEDRMKAIKAGMDSHVAKPVNIEKVFKAISEVIQRKGENRRIIL